MSDRIFIDTNIFVYALLDTDEDVAQYPSDHAIANRRYVGSRFSIWNNIFIKYITLEHWCRAMETHRLTAKRP